ncbi:MAG: IS1 family transposase [Cyanobacteria bacterium P01_G01_bin.19]
MILKVEVDEMKSYVGKKSYQRWLWHAIDHKTGAILAFVLGRRQDRVFLKLKRLLKPFGITKFYTDNLKTYERHLNPEERTVSKYKMQKIERKHLTLRTRFMSLEEKSNLLHFFITLPNCSIYFNKISHPCGKPRVLLPRM